MLFLLVLGEVRVLLVVVLRPVLVLLFHLEPLHIVLVHDLLDSLVVVQNRQSRHFVEVGQELLKVRVALDEFVASVHQSLALLARVDEGACETRLVRLLAPVEPLAVVEGLGAEEFAVQNLSLVIGSVL